MSTDLSLQQPSFRKELQELDEKWSMRMARLEALLTIGHHPASQPSFSLVKAPVAHKPPAGSLSHPPFLLSSIPFGQAGPASGPDQTQTIITLSVDMVFPLENWYQESDPEPVFAQPASSGPVIFSYEQCVEPLLVSARNISPPEQVEEGELSELDDQPEQDNNDPDRAISEDQNYRETVRWVCAFMGWSHIPELEYSPTSRADNPWIGHRSQPVGKVSVLLPPEDWLCKKLENLIFCSSKVTLPSLQSPVDQYLHPPKSQSR